MLDIVRRLVARDGFRAALVLFGVLLVCFWPCIVGNKTFLESARDAPSILPGGAWAGKPLYLTAPKGLDPGAPAWLSEPLLALIGHEYLGEKTIPLWNPYQGYGQPLAADMQSQAFFPLSAALALNPGPRTYNWYILLRLFIAGICSYFYLRLLVSYPAAVAGGITAMLSGYYILYLTMPQLSVETLLPAAMLAAELFLRDRTYRKFVLLALILALVLIGGMPESSLLIVTFVSCYILYRVLCHANLRYRWLWFCNCFSMAVIAAGCLAAFLLLPFCELLKRSLDFHQSATGGGPMPGFFADRLDRSIATYLFPLLFGPAQGITGWSEIRNYAGVISIFLIVMALAALFRKQRDPAEWLSTATWFYLAGVVVIVLKRYGSAFVSWIGFLPLYRMVNFPKYDEVLLSFCVSMLCAIGVERLARRQVRVGIQAIGLGVTALLIPITVFCCRPSIRYRITQEHVRKILPLFACLLPTFLLFVLALLLVFLTWQGRKGVSPLTGGRRFALCVIGVLTIEGMANYILPTYYSISRLPRQSSNPYQGAPFVSTLRGMAGHFRIFARDSVLFPDWASAFELADIRDLDAIYINKYFPFVRNFIDPSGPELVDRFTGLGDYEFGTGSGRRLLQLSSVKFIATLRPYSPPNNVVRNIINQDAGHLTRGRENLIGIASLIINGVARECLTEHPPYERLPYKLTIGKGQDIFYFGYALNPAVFDKAGDGVGFRIEVKDAAGKISTLFSRYIDPKRDVQERRWMDSSIDLSRYQGQQIELLFSTDPGPKGDSAYDWAAWSGLHFAGRTSGKQEFHLVYDGEARVYEYDDVLPRAAIYDHADVRASSAEVLRRLADSSLDIFKTVVLSASDLDPERVERLAQMNRLPAEPVRAAKIATYSSRTVGIEASLDRNGILVLNDSAYPGWTVNVDGHPAKWFTANYMFRGVFLGPGKHLVTFSYRPASFYWGAGLSGFTCLLFVALGLSLERKRRVACTAAQKSDVYMGQ